jgi:hypothetical protein
MTNTSSALLVNSFFPLFVLTQKVEQKSQGKQKLRWFCRASPQPAVITIFTFFRITIFPACYGKKLQALIFRSPFIKL